MKLVNYITALIFILLAFSCETDEDKLYSLDYIPAPSNVTVTFDITSDNSGIVTILPNADGAQQFEITFGDTVNETPTVYKLNEVISHTYEEGTYEVGITAVGMTGLKTSITEDLVVTFSPPENLNVTITIDVVDPKKVTFKATADLATSMDFYFGDTIDEVPTQGSPGEEVVHNYAEAGDYVIKVVAKNSGSGTVEFTDTVTISGATDPVNLPVNFESLTVNYAFEDFGNVVSSVVDNPDATGENTSSKVAKSVKPSGAETWAGTFLTLENPIDFSTKKIVKVKVWSPKSGITVKLKVENLTDGGIAMEVDATTTVADEWEELSFDFSTINTGNEYQKVVIFFDFGNTGDDSEYYFDDIKLISAATDFTIEDFEGTPPEFTVFGNIDSVAIIANPDAAGVNTSATVASYTKPTGSETWAGVYFEVDTPLDMDSYSKIKVKTWSPVSGIVVKVKLENDDASITHEIDVTNTTANSWEELTYDFSGASAAVYNTVVIFFDFGNSGDDSIYYFDDFMLSN